MTGGALVIDAVRTPRGRGKPERGALSGVHPQDLLAPLLRSLPERIGLTPSDVDDVVVGCASQVGEQGACVARLAVLAAGWPIEVPGVAVQRVCGSALQAVHFAAMATASGFHDLVLAGGVESMSRVPMAADGGGLDGRNPRVSENGLVPQGISGDLLATLEGMTRAELDDLALRSQRRAVTAIDERRFARSLVPVTEPDGRVVLAREELPRPDTTADGLAALAPVFADLGRKRPRRDGATFDELAVRRYPAVKEMRHLHTVGTSSALADGAGIVVFASARFAAERGLRPRARVRSVGVAGVDPVIMLTGLVPATKKALARAGMQVADVDVWEINEAFAAVPIHAMRHLGIDPERVNVNGGAIALGHPLGATGAMLLGTALDELERSDKSVAAVTLCMAGGMGMTTIIERVSS